MDADIRETISDDSPGTSANVVLLGMLAVVFLVVLVVVGTAFYVIRAQ